MAALINNTAFSWSSISFKLSFLQNNLMGITAISYKKTRNSVLNYGAGSEPVSRGFGNNEYEASISLSLAEINKISQQIPSGTLLDIDPFDVVVKYATPDGLTMVDTIKGCVFTEDGRDASQNDPEIVVDLPLQPTSIEYNDTSLI